MPFRPSHVAPRASLCDFDDPDLQLGSPDLFYATRLRAQPVAPSQPDALNAPKPATVPPRAAESAPHTTIEYLRFRGKPRSAELSAGWRSAWKARMEIALPNFVSSLASSLPFELEGGEITTQRTGSSLENVDLVLRLACPRTGEVAGSLEHEVCFQDSFPKAYLSPAGFGWEIERQALGNAVRLYDQLGVPQVRVTVTGELGFALARAGFVPETEEDAWELLCSLRERLQEFDMATPTRILLESLLSGHHPDRLWQLVDLDRARLVSAGKRTLVGRALLAGMEWPAVLNLDDPVARSRFSRQVRRV